MQIVTPHIQKWAHLKPNQHCRLTTGFRGDHYWVNASDQYHRVDENGIQDGPAVIWADGTQFWFFHGTRHRWDGPAIIHPEGWVEYYLNNRRVQPSEWSEQLLQKISATLKTMNPAITQ